MKKSYFFTLLVSFLTLFSQEIYADNKLTVENLTINAGEQGVLEVYLTKDNSLLASYQMDLELPDGFTIPQYEEDEEYYYSVETSDEMHKKDGSLLVAEIIKGVNISYLNSKTLKSAENGLLLSITIDVASTVSPGTYNLKFSDIKFSTNEDPATEVLMEDVSFTITVPGDAETVTIPISNEWNTYCCAKALNFEGVAGVKAYVVSSVTATQAITTQVTQVPAGEGFLIQKTVADVTSIEVPVIASAAEVTNELVGVTEETPITAGNYVLSDGKFLPCNEGTLPANKAYLPQDAVPTSAGAKGITIVFDGNTTGINEIQKAETDGAIYNLSGMRVSKTQKGVYIMNGRKVIVK